MIKKKCQLEGICVFLANQLMVLFLLLFRNT